MKKKLLEVRKNFVEKFDRSLSEKDLQYVTGGNGTALLSGSGTSSTSGLVCCDATCVCKRYPLNPELED